MLPGTRSGKLLRPSMPCAWGPARQVYGLVLVRLIPTLAGLAPPPPLAADFSV